MRALFVGALFALALATSPAARGCGAGGNGAMGAVLLVGILAGGSVLAGDVVFTGMDVAGFVNGEHPSRDLALGELVLGGPQFALGIVALSDPRQVQVQPLLLGYTIWTGLLTAHGVWGFLSQPVAAPAPPAQAPQEALGLETRAPARIAVSVGPTAVAIGGRVWTGFGVSGRY